MAGLMDLSNVRSTVRSTWQNDYWLPDLRRHQIHQYKMHVIFK
jgi:hypothetical protein